MYDYVIDKYFLDRNFKYSLPNFDTLNFNKIITFRETTLRK